MSCMHEGNKNPGAVWQPEYIQSSSMIIGSIESCLTAVPPTWSGAKCPTWTDRVQDVLLSPASNIELPRGLALVVLHDCVSLQVSLYRDLIGLS